MKDIPEEERGTFFVKWVSSYYKHGDLSTRDFSQLQQLEGDPSRKPTADTMSLEELQSIMDFGPAVKYEMVFIDSKSFSSAFLKQTKKALFDPQIREAWGEHPVSFVYCEDSIWNVHYAAWNLEKFEEFKASEINVRSIPRANHFVSPFFSPSIRSNLSETCYFIIVNVGRSGKVLVNYEGRHFSLKRFS